MEIRANIAETVRRVMEERGKTLPELSAELDIPLSSMKNYAKGAKNLRADTIDMLAWKLGLTPAELISQLPSGWAEAEVTVQAARAFGDLSENFEYKAAKQEKNRNDSRCRYLENVIRTATIISDKSQEGTVGLYDKVTLYVEDDEEEMVIQIVTTMRQDALKGLVSKESPVGRAVLGRRVGDRVTVQVNDNYGYDVIIRAIEPGEDNGEAPLVSF